MRHDIAQQHRRHAIQEHNGQHDQPRAIPVPYLDVDNGGAADGNGKSKNGVKQAVGDPQGPPAHAVGVLEGADAAGLFEGRVQHHGGGPDGLDEGEEDGVEGGADVEGLSGQS